MNRIFFCFLTGLCLLLLALACNRTPEPVPPMLIGPIGTTTTPPSSTTTAPVTSTTATTPPISFSFGEGPAPVNLANCRVIQQVVKLGLSSFGGQPYPLPLIDLEIVVVAGESYTIAAQNKTTYQYDQKGLLVKEANIRYGGDTSSTTYIYRNGFALKQQNNNPVDTLWLNAQGFVRQDPGYDYTYNQEGYLTNRKIRKSFLNTQFIIENGNAVRIIYYDYGTWTDDYTYNLAQKNTITNAGLYGMPDRNVRTNHTVVTEGVSPEYAPNGKIREDDIYTEFDKVMIYQFTPNQVSLVNQSVAFWCKFLPIIFVL